MRVILVALVLTALSLTACSIAPAAQKEGLAVAYAADAKTMCELVPKVYAFHGSRASHWQEACDQAQIEAASVTTPRQGTTMLEHLVEGLWDNHASLGVNTGISPWLVPSGSDMWLELQGASVVVTGVRHDGAAAHAGIQPGDVVMSIDGKMPIEAALARIRTGKADVPPTRMAWALNAAGAGFRGQSRTLVLLRGGQRLETQLGDPAPAKLDDPVSARMIGDVGYIRFNDSLGDDDTVAAFDAAVEGLRGAKGWIVDVRDTPSGGSTDVAEPIMGRFVTLAADYQITRPLHQPAYARKIEPRGPWTLTGPVAVLAGRWTGSMGEGMAIGFDGMKRGVVVGGSMAGLAGGVEVFNLPATDTNLRLPAYALTHVDGTPRQEWAPKERVQPDAGGTDDPALARALALVGAP
jgi:carboxyl-terminal processing protease